MLLKTLAMLLAHMKAKKQSRTFKILGFWVSLCTDDNGWLRSLLKMQTYKNLGLEDN